MVGSLGFVELSMPFVFLRISRGAGREVRRQSSFDRVFVWGTYHILFNTVAYAVYDALHCADMIS